MGCPNSRKGEQHSCWFQQNSDSYPILIHLTSLYLFCHSCQTRSDKTTMNSLFHLLLIIIFELIATNKWNCITFNHSKQYSMFCYWVIGWDIFTHSTSLNILVLCNILYSIFLWISILINEKLKILDILKLPTITWNISQAFIYKFLFLILITLHRIVSFDYSF